MKDPKVYLTSLIIAIIATLTLATGIILILMFSVHDESAYRTGLFGSVYFRAAPNPPRQYRRDDGCRVAATARHRRSRDICIHPPRLSYLFSAQGLPCITHPIIVRCGNTRGISACSR